MFPPPLARSQYSVLISRPPLSPPHVSMATASGSSRVEPGAVGARGYGGTDVVVLKGGGGRRTGNCSHEKRSHRGRTIERGTSHAPGAFCPRRVLHDLDLNARPQEHFEITKPFPRRNIPVANPPPPPAPACIAKGGGGISRGGQGGQGTPVGQRPFRCSSARRGTPQSHQRWPGGARDRAALFMLLDPQRHRLPRGRTASGDTVPMGHRGRRPHTASFKCPGLYAMTW